MVVKNIKSSHEGKKNAKLTRPGSYEESVDSFWLVSISARSEINLTGGIKNFLRVLLKNEYHERGRRELSMCVYPRKAKNPVNSRRLDINRSEYDR